MNNTSTYTGCQTDFSTPLFPKHPVPSLEEIGDLPLQFKVIDAYLKLPDSVRENDRDLVWRVVVGLIQQQSGVPW